jgi:hypothetical protein
MCLPLQLTPRILTVSASIVRKGIKACLQAPEGMTSFRRWDILDTACFLEVPLVTLRIPRYNNQLYLGTGLN